MQAIDWIRESIDRPELEPADLNDGFVLLQLLSLLSPSSVDLTWYTTEEALSCHNLQFRNFQALAKGTKLFQKDLKTSQKDKIEHHLVKILDLVDFAKAGDSEAVLSIGTELFHVHELMHPKEMEEKDLMMMEEDCYQPTERAFRPLVRWLLRRSYQLCSSKQMKKELKKALASVSKPQDTIPSTVQTLLCHGRVYTLLASHLFQLPPVGFNSLVCTEEEATTDFLDLLIKKGYFNVKKTMRASVKSMMMDKTPFYESIHVNVISALLGSSARETDPESVVKHLKRFDTFDPQQEYPYDIEDAMLMWMNHLLKAAKEHKFKDFLEDLEEDFEDLGKDMESGWMFCIVLMWYFDTERCKLSLSDKLHNFKMLDQLVTQVPDLWLPWLPEDQREEDTYTGNMCWLYVHFLCDVLQVIETQDKNKVVLPPLLNPVEEAKPVFSLQSGSSESKQEDLKQQQASKKKSQIPESVKKSVSRESIKPSHLPPLKLEDSAIDLKEKWINQEPFIVSESDIVPKERVFSGRRGRKLTLSREQLPIVPKPPTILANDRESSSLASLSRQSSVLPSLSDQVVLQSSTILEQSMELSEEPAATHHPQDVREEPAEIHHPQDVKEEQAEVEQELDLLEQEDTEQADAEQTVDTIEQLEEEPRMVRPSGEQEPRMESPKEADMDEMQSFVENVDSKLLLVESMSLPLSTPEMQSFAQDQQLSPLNPDPVQVEERASFGRPPSRSPEPHLTASLPGDSRVTASQSVDVLQITSAPADVQLTQRHERLSPIQPIDQTTLSTARDPMEMTIAELERPKSGLQSFPLPEHPKREEEGALAWDRVRESKGFKKKILNPVNVEEEQRKRRQKLKMIQKLKLERQEQKEREKRLEEERKLQLKNEQIEKQQMINKEKQKKRQMQEDRKSRQKSASLKPVKSVKSNKTLIRNALQHVCLAGTVNEAVKQQVLEDLEESDASHFIILFRDTNNFLFRGLYFWDPTLDQTVKLYSGVPGPTVLDPDLVMEYYKYDSGARTFKTVPTKSFGRSVHAVAIPREFPTLKMSL